MWRGEKCLLGRMIRPTLHRGRLIIGMFARSKQPGL